MVSSSTRAVLVWRSPSSWRIEDRPRDRRSPGHGELRSPGPAQVDVVYILNVAELLGLPLEALVLPHLRNGCDESAVHCPRRGASVGEEGRGDS